MAVLLHEWMLPSDGKDYRVLKLQGCMRGCRCWQGRRISGRGRARPWLLPVPQALRDPRR